MKTHNVRIGGKITTLMTSLSLGIFLMLISALPAFADESLSLNSERRHVACTSLSEAAAAYYTDDYTYEHLTTLPGAADTTNSYVATQGNQLYNALQDLMSSTLDKEKLPVYSGFGEGSLSYYWNMTDTSPDVNNSDEISSHFLMFYSDAKYEYPGNTVTMNREHIWPKSHASFHQMNGGSDLHHLRPSAKVVNEVKGDHSFGYVDECFAYGYDTGMLDGAEVYKAYPKKDLFEPKDDVKGDVARILLYVYCCWGQPNLYSDISKEYLPKGDDDEVTNTGGRVITDLDTLLAWCEYDPVDTWEMKRNDLTQQVQGNRNVFIDYPELAWLLFGRDIPQGMQTPTHEGCAHSWGQSFTNASSCTQAGSRSETCTICGNVHTVPTPALGHVDEDHDNICDRCETELLGTFTLADNVSSGMHLLVYHPTSGEALSEQVNSGNRINGNPAVVNDGEILPPEGTAVFLVAPAEGGGFYLLHDGKYLTTPQNGTKLFWTDTVDDYACWDFVSCDDGTFNILNLNAGSPDKRYALQYYNDSFTTYRISDTDAFKFKLFISDSHAWKEVSRTKPTCTDTGSLVFACMACGERKERELGALGHQWADPSYAWAEALDSVTAIRTCTRDGSHVETETVNTTAQVTKEPSTTEEGEITYTATFENPAFERQTKQVPMDKLDPSVTSIQDADVVLSRASFTYNGKTQRPRIQAIGGNKLAEGTDYTAEWSDSTSKDAGTYTVTITGKGAYTGTTSASYQITKAANQLSARSHVAIVSYLTLRRHARTLPVSRVLSLSRQAKGALTFTKLSGDRRISVDEQTGAVTIQKGLKWGVYPVKVKVLATGDDNYEPSAAKTVTFTVVVL